MTAAIFKAARRALGLNQTSLAHALGVSRETVSNWERSNPPRVASLAIQTLANTVSSPAKVRAEEGGEI